MSKIICDKDGNREMTPEELAEYNSVISGVDTFPESLDERIALQESKFAQRKVLLDKLGLTEEEAKLLLS